MKNQNRNELCNCGSGKKFKKCCENVNSLNSEDSYYRIVKGNRELKNFNDSEIVKWRTSISKLPNEIKRIINEYLIEEIVVNYCCYYNSFLLSLKDERIKTIQGWYGMKMNETQIKDFKLNNKYYDKSGVYIDTNGYGFIYIDTKNWTEYHPHSWNEFEGICFDITTENNPLYNKWINYVKVKTLDIKPIISNKCIKDYYIHKTKQILTSTRFHEQLNNNNLYNLVG